MNIPDVPVKDLGGNLPHQGHDINLQGEDQIQFEQLEFPSYSNNITDTPWNEYTDALQNRHIPITKQRNIPRIKKFEPAFDDINANLPKIDEYVLYFNVPKFKNYKNIPPKFNTHVFTVPQLNKLSFTYYEMAVSELADLVEYNTDLPIVNKFSGDLTSKLNENIGEEFSLKDPSPSRKEEKKKRIGQLFLKFIRKEKYVKNYIRFLKFGLLGGLKRDDVQKALATQVKHLFDLNMALHFEKIATVPIMFSTIEGYEYITSPDGLVTSQREYKMNKKFGFQEIVRYKLGHNKYARFPSIYKQYLDEIALFYGIVDNGPVITFMDKPPNVHDFYERSTFNRIASRLICGTNSVMDRKYKTYAGFDQKNYYERIKRLSNKKNVSELIKTYAEFARKYTTLRADITIGDNDLKNRIGLLIYQFYVPTGNVHQDYAAIAKEIFNKKDQKFWRICFAFTLYSNVPLQKSRRVWNVYLKQWITKIVLKKRKTIFRVVDPQGSKVGNTFDCMIDNGIDRLNFPNLPHHMSNLKNIQKRVLASNRVRVTVVP